MPLRLSKFLTRRNCLIGKDVVFYPGSSIVNNYGPQEAISVGSFSHVKGELLTFGHGGRITIGEYCYIGENSRLWSACSLVICDRVLISHSVNIFDNGTHPIAPKARHEQFKSIVSMGQPKQISLGEKPVKICADVLVGCMSIILAGVTIGECSIVGAGSVVTRDIPPWTIVAGNPARIIREIPEHERQ